MVRLQVSTRPSSVSGKLQVSPDINPDAAVTRRRRRRIMPSTNLSSGSSTGKLALHASAAGDLLPEFVWRVLSMGHRNCPTVWGGEKAGRDM